MIRTSYDPEADAVAVRFRARGSCVESQEVAPGIILDFEAQGQVIGIEVLDVKTRSAGQVSGDIETSGNSGKSAAAE